MAPADGHDSHGGRAQDLASAPEKAGDASHQPARDEMKARWRRPRKALGWYRDTKQAFADLPDESA